MTFHARIDRRFIRSTYRSNRFVLVELTAPTSRRTPTREPLDLAFVLDRSGSMAGQKLDLAKRAIEQGMSALHDRDRFSIVAYDDQVDVVVESRHATTAARREALARLARIEARGSTNLFEGWLRGCEQVAAHLAATDVNRCLLLSDGLANRGVTDVAELERHAEELRRRGVATWTFGVGADFDHQLLERMALAGGGQSFFIELPEQIPDHITGAVGEALDIVLRDVRLEVTLGEGALGEPLSLYPHHSEGDRLVVELRDLVSEQRLEVVLRLNFPFGEIGQRRSATLVMRDRDGLLDEAPVALDWEYADHRTNDLQPRDRDVDRAVARIFAARARQEAARFNQAGSYKLASERLSAVAGRIRRYAGSDPDMLSIVAELERERQAVAAPLPAMAIKEMHFQSSYMLRARDIQGKARKG